MNQHEWAETIIKEYFENKYKILDEKIGEQDGDYENEEILIKGSNEEVKRLENEKTLLEEIESELEEWVRNDEEINAN